MITRQNKKMDKVQIISMEDLVPKEHLLRKIKNCIDFKFIYDLVEDRYSSDKGRPSMDPVMLIKIPIIQYMFGIKSMRQTIKEIEVNVAYRWFLGIDFYERGPHLVRLERITKEDLKEQICLNKFL